MNAKEHYDESERLLAVGQVHLTEAVATGCIDDTVDLAGLYFDKAQVHAVLAVAATHITESIGR